MPTPEKSDAENMTGASGQRWEPADEGVIVEAPNQPPPGSDQPPPRDANAPDPIQFRPGRSSDSEGDESRP